MLRTRVASPTIEYITSINFTSAYGVSNPIPRATTGVQICDNETQHLQTVGRHVRASVRDPLVLPALVPLVVC